MLFSCINPQKTNGEGAVLRNFLYECTVWLYAIAFNLFRLFPVQANRVGLLAPNAEAASLRVLEQELRRRGKDVFFVPVHGLKALDKLRFYSVWAYKLATASKIFMNDNFTPLRLLRFSKKAKVVQVWHAEGELKRFGLAANIDGYLRKKVYEPAATKYTAVLCTSPAIVSDYAEAFGIPAANVLPLGSPRTDTLLRQAGKQGESRQTLERKYPRLKGKRAVLYAPTFRPEAEGSRAAKEALLRAFDFAAFAQRYGQDTILFVRLHPHVSRQLHLHMPKTASLCAINITDEPDALPFILGCDVVITDYSSICMDAVLLDKPVLCYAFDYAQYSKSPGFFEDMKTLPPGVIVETFTELLLALEHPMPLIGSAKAAFLARHLAACDGRCTDRILEI
jgi:CDP-ribitol ribitolphosphotransferase